MPVTKTSNKKEKIKSMPKKKASMAGPEEKKVASKQAASTRANVSSTKESTQRPRSKLDKLGDGDPNKSSGRSSVKNISFKDGKKVEKLSGRGTEIDNKTHEKRSKREMKDVLRARAKDEAASKAKKEARKSAIKSVAKKALKAIPLVGTAMLAADTVQAAGKVTAKKRKESYKKKLEEKKRKELKS